MDLEVPLYCLAAMFIALNPRDYMGQSMAGAVAAANTLAVLGKYGDAWTDIDGADLDKCFNNRSIRYMLTKYYGSINSSAF